MNQNLPIVSLNAENKLLLRCRIQPSASRSSICGKYGEEALKISLKSPPVDGKANEELCSFLAKTLKISRSLVTIKSGMSSRSKTVLISGIKIETLKEIIDIK